MSNLRKVIEQMNKYGFTAPDMTVTEFVEDILLTISKTESVECEDCISRESACQKMMEMYKEDCEMYGVEIPECFDGHRAVRALMELPPAQPEIIRCKDCRYSEQDMLYDDRYCHYDGKADIVPDEHYCGYAERREDE